MSLLDEQIEMGYRLRAAKDLLQRANVPVENIEARAERIQTGPLNQTAYENYLSALATIRKYKVLSYGTSRYEVTNQQFDLAMCFSDIHRKYIRIKEMIFNSGGQATTESLKEAAGDLANYAIMLIEIAVELELLEHRKHGAASPL